MGVEALSVAEFYSILGDKIRMARKAKRMDQETLGQQIGLNRTSVINIEKGRQKPSIYHLWIMARILEIQVMDLLPAYDLRSQMRKWENKIQSNEQIESEVDKLKALEFITFTSTTK